LGGSIWKRVFSFNYSQRILRLKAWIKTICVSRREMSCGNRRHVMRALGSVAGRGSRTKSSILRQAFEFVGRFAPLWPYGARSPSATQVKALRQQGAGPIPQSPKWPRESQHGQRLICARREITARYGPLHIPLSLRADSMI